MEDLIRSSNVLVFEDIVGEPDLAGDRRVSDAVEMMGFSGGKVVNVNDAMGNFKAQLLSGTAWDLIIVAAEARTNIQGEFWDYIMDQLNEDTALIAEVWYLDEINFGKIGPVLSKCGISLHKDWWRETNDQMLDYSILNLVPDHPVLTSRIPV